MKRKITVATNSKAVLQVKNQGTLPAIVATKFLKFVKTLRENMTNSVPFRLDKDCKLY